MCSIHVCMQYAACISKLHDVKLLLGDVLHYPTGGLSLSMFGYNAQTSKNITMSCIPVHGICQYVRFAQSSVFIRLPNHPPSTKHIVVLDTYCHGAPGSREIPIQSLQHFILQTSAITFCFICCHLWPLRKRQRVFFLSGRTVKVWIHASSHSSYSFLMLLLHTISGCNYCHMHIHTTYIISMHTLCLYILGVAPSSSSRMKVYRNPLQKSLFLGGCHIYSQAHLGSFQLPNGVARSGFDQALSQGRTRSTRRCEISRRWYKTKV